MPQNNFFFSSQLYSFYYVIESNPNIKKNCTKIINTNVMQALRAGSTTFYIVVAFVEILLIAVLQPFVSNFFIIIIEILKWHKRRKSSSIFMFFLTFITKIFYLRLH